MARRKRGDDIAHDEPRAEGEDWVGFGGELIWVAGYTSNGFPYGFSADEYRRANARDHAAAGWARAKHILADLFAMRGGPRVRVEVGYVTRIGEGLSRDVFGAEVVVRERGAEQAGTYVVLLPRRDADPALDARTRKELRLLGRLEQQELPFRVPEVVGAYPDGGRLVLVRQFLRGVALDTRAGRQPVRPWEIVGEIAAAIHALPGVHLEDIVPGHATRRAHAEAALHVFDGLDAPEAREARAWAAEHLPPPDPSSLVHGDLLGQNILLDPSDRTAVIDWEYATRGDPAHDLAIVTRGAKQPFQLPGGLDKLLDAYRDGGGEGVTRQHVRIHELCLTAGLYRDALAGVGPHGPDHELARLRSLLRRAVA